MSRSNDIAGLTTSILDGVTATEVGLGNVTNESKATMFASPTFTGTTNVSSGVTLPSNPTITLGSNATFPSGTITNYIANTTTITGAQTLDNTLTTVTGSLISSYTPTTGASKVYYQVNLKIGHDGDVRGISTFVPFLDGSALNDKTGFSMDTHVGYGSFGDYVTFYALISASGWTSGKNVELKAREYSSTYQMQLHLNGNFKNSSGDAVNAITVYNDVNTVIYSIM